MKACALRARRWKPGCAARAQYFKAQAEVNHEEPFEAADALGRKRHALGRKRHALGRKRHALGRKRRFSPEQQRGDRSAAPRLYQ